MAELFEETILNHLTLANRFVRSATWEGMAAPDGSATAGLVDLMANLARGGVGLIVTGHAYVSPEGQASPGQLGVHTDALIEGLRKMTETVHQAGGKIALQLAHAGIQAPRELTGTEPWGPSIFGREPGLPIREMTEGDIGQVVEKFGAAAGRAREAGFDAVQIHAAHGYLLSQFLSPFFNYRQDGYGGSLANRARLVLSVLGRIRRTVGDRFPVLIKINSEDFVTPGLTVAEMLSVAKMLEAAGIDAIELSGGTAYSGRNVPVRSVRKTSPDEEVYYEDAARQFKQKIRVPLMLVGGIRSYPVAERLVREGSADYISLCRPLIREPHLVNRWKSGDTSRASCRSDGLCFKPAREGRGLYCVVEARSRSQRPG